MFIMDGLDDNLVRFIEGLRKIDFDHNSISIGSRRKALCPKNSIRFLLLKPVRNNQFQCDMRRSTHCKMSEKHVLTLQQRKKSLSLYKLKAV